MKVFSWLHTRNAWYFSRPTGATNDLSGLSLKTKHTNNSNAVLFSNLKANKSLLDCFGMCMQCVEFLLFIWMNDEVPDFPQGFPYFF